MTILSDPPVKTSPAGSPTAGTSYERRRDIRSRSVDEQLSAPGAAVSALALVWLVFTYVLPWSGWVGFVLCWLVTFLVLLTALTALTSPRPIVIDRLLAATVTAGATIVGKEAQVRERAA